METYLNTPNFQNFERSCTITTISNAFVLGAGLGTRLKPFTDRLPKPLIPIMGVPCIDFALSKLMDYGIKNAHSTVVVNVHAHAQQMHEHLKKYQKSFRLVESDETQKLLGSAGGFRKAIDFFKPNDAFIAMNADVICNVDLKKLVERHQELKKRHSVVMTLALATGSLVLNTKGSYREIKLDRSNGLITGFGDLQKHQSFYLGVGVFEPEAFQHLTLNEVSEFVPEVLSPWIQKKRVGFFELDDLWMDIGSPELWWDAHQQFKRLLTKDPGSISPDWLHLIQSEQGQWTGMDSGWIQYRRHQNLNSELPSPLGKQGIQLDDLIYELPL